MKANHIIFGVFLLFTFSCKTHLHVANVTTEKNAYITKDISENQDFIKIIDPYKQELESKMNAKISHTDVELNKKGENSNLGNLLADYTFEGAVEWANKNNIPQIDAAVINIGGIRSIIGAGDIITKQIYEVMPFENEVVVVKIKGNDIQDLFNYYVKTQKNNPVSHLIIETDAGVLKQALISGKPVDASKIYYIATSDYLALGGDNMSFFGKGEIISTGIKMRDLFLEKFKKNPEVKIPTDVRLSFKNKKIQDNE